LKRLLLFALLGTTLPSFAQVVIAASNTSLLIPNHSYIVCGSGFTSSDCRFRSGILQIALRDLRVEIPGWRWVIVATANWRQTAQSFGVDPGVPAFSSFAVSTTYIESRLVTLEQRTDEQLQGYTKLSGMPRLRWVLAHESGHILCQTASEAKAETAGKRLTSGNRNVCR
jgi:hypothetical protein